ncbi:ATP-binding protein [Luteimonas sp. JM171]|uniref:Dph6-related ATP pyrophosphatase n=1 Tax=Luteimonas sp. JM171 TaxID=1896164 RepID=UPI00085648E0|nr:ATP-binding protein [Luteimonas sp. JM171]AOH35572.1 ATP-binding protein [Luteimonas sp. JM171]
MGAVRTPALLSWSGGKDAAWTLHALRQAGDVEVVGLLCTLTEGHDRASMQGVRREVVQAQADATGLPLVEAWIPQQCDNATYEAAFAAALGSARERWPGLATIAFGDLLLADVRDWRQASCARLGWRALFPLFGADTARIARQMIDAGLRTHLCCVDTQLLDAGFAGRAFNHALLADLPEGVDPCGENGEFHTCVSAGPMFDRPLPLQRGDTVLRDGRFAYTDFKP